jgi:glycosylphosphatidylinositol phospholipase D
MIKSQPPFIQAFADLIHHKYPRPWNVTTTRIIAFALGQVSHSVSDILWHDISEVKDLTAQGFIQAQSAIYLDLDYSVSHTEADVGAEFAMASSTSIAWLEDKWYAPTLDLQEVYISTGMTDVTVDAIEEGLLLLFSASHLVANTWQTFDPVEEFVSPFVQENLFDYFIGGIDDSSQWTAACWPSLIRWIESGADNIQMCIVEPPTTDQGKMKDGSNMHAPRGILQQLMARPNFKMAMNVFKQFVNVHRSHEDRGTFFSLLEPIDVIVNAIKTMTINDPVIEAKKQEEKLESEKVASSCGSLMDSPNVLRVSVDGMFANLGESMVQGDFDGDGMLEMAIGAPGYTKQAGMEQSGAVFVVDIPKAIVGQRSVTLSPSQLNITTISGDYRAGRFGQALTTVDLNRDGIDDLVVSQPRYMAHELSYRGRIFVYYGTRHGLSTEPWTMITLNGDVGNYTMMGASLSSGDLDGDGFADLIIGSPFSCNIEDICTDMDDGLHQRGLVSVFLSSKWQISPTVDLGKADQSIEGHNAYYWLGMRSAVMFNASVTPPLLITTAPIGNYTNDAVAPGCMLIYDFKSLNKTETTEPTPLSSIYTSSPGAKLGWSFSIGSPYVQQQQSQNHPDYLVISAPSEIAPSKQSNTGPLFEAGRIYIAPTSLLVSQSQGIDSHSLISVDGTERYGRFGWSTLMKDLDHDGIDDLIVSAPLEADQQGRVYFWKGGKSFPAASTSAHSRTMCLQHSTTTKQGTSSKNWPRLGQLLLPISATRTSPTLLAITAPRDSTNMDEAGSVYIVQL